MAKSKEPLPKPLKADVPLGAGAPSAVKAQQPAAGAR